MRPVFSWEHGIVKPVVLGGGSGPRKVGAHAVVAYPDQPVAVGVQCQRLAKRLAKRVGVGLFEFNAGGRVIALTKVND